LWGLLAIPLLVLLYLLRARRRDHPVSSLLLWQRCASQRSGYRPSRKIERSLLLILQILTVAALVAGLARPTLIGSGVGGTAVMFVLETSFSMRARDVLPTRLARARAEALDLASHLRPGQKAGVIITAPRAQVLVPLTEDRQRVLDALRSVDAWDTVGDVAGALTLAAAQPLGDDGRIVAWTDGAGGPLPDYPRVTYRLVGTSDDNVGITAFRIARDSRGNQALVRVDNFAATGRRVPLEVVRNDTVVHRAVLSVPAAGSRAVVFPVPGSGVLHARLGVHDMLPEDDEATAVVDAAPLPSVLLVSPGNPYLETLLRLLPVPRAAETPVVEPSTWSAFGVIILDRIDPGPLPPGEYLLIGTVPSNLPIRAAGEVLHPNIARWERTDPVLRFVNLEDVRIARALTLTPQGGRVLAEGEVPLLWAYEGHGIRALVLGFALQDSTLPLHVAFPLLIANSLAWLGGGPVEIRAGDAPLVPAGGEKDAVLVGPDGHRQTVRAVDGMYLVSPFARAGLYVLKTPTATRQFAVTVGSPKAGAIRPGQPPPAAAPAAVGSLAVRPTAEHPAVSHAVVMRVPLWPWCLLVAVALAVGEWAVITRRRGGVA
jgi:hypothetical protein